MAREMLLAGVDPEELRPSQPEPPPQTPRGKLENFWYHYKWPVIGAALALTALVIILVMTFAQDKPDYQVVLVTQEAAGEKRTTALSELLAPYATDLDGDGKVEVAVENLMLSEEEAAGRPVAAADAQQLMSYFATGDRMLFVFEPSCFEQRVASQEHDGYVFFDALTVRAAGYEAGEHYWDWQGSACRLQEELSYLPPSLYFGVRAPTGMANNQNSIYMNEQGKALLEAFIANQK